MNPAIAIIQTAYLGDAALAMIFAEQVHRMFPDSKVLFVCRPEARHLAEAHPSISRTFVFDKRRQDSGIRGIVRIASEIRAEQPRVVFCLQRSIRTALVALASSAPTRIGFDTAAGSWLFTHRVKYPTSVHEIERNTALLSVFRRELPQPVIPIPLRLNPSQQANVNTALERTSPGPRVAIAPATIWATKQWLPERFEEVAKALHRRGISVAFLGGAHDRELCTAIAQRSGGTVLAGELDPAETVAYLQSCAVLLANDSAPTHLATLASCPTVTIFGSTIPAFGFGPRAPGSVIIEPPPLHCRPCGVHGRKRCPRGTLECMHSITTADVLERVRTILEQTHS